MKKAESKTRKIINLLCLILMVFCVMLLSACSAPATNNSKTEETEEANKKKAEEKKSEKKETGEKEAGEKEAEKEKTEKKETEKKDAEKDNDNTNDGTFEKQDTDAEPAPDKNSYERYYVLYELTGYQTNRIGDPDRDVIHGYYWDEDTYSYWLDDEDVIAEVNGSYTLTMTAYFGQEGQDQEGPQTFVVYFLNCFLKEDVSDYWGIRPYDEPSGIMYMDSYGPNGGTYEFYVAASDYLERYRMDYDFDNPVITNLYDGGKYYFKRTSEKIPD